MKKYIVIFIFFLNIQLWPNNYCNDVFDRLVNSIITDNLRKPTLKIVENDNLVATTTNKGEIFIGSRFINLCRNFKSDSSNALAHVLSHELAHYYLEHLQRGEFTSAYASPEWGKMLNTKDTLLIPIFETQADEMGFFYALNAGYESWRVSASLLDSIYLWYDLPNIMKGYPPLEERKKICESAAGKVRALTPLYRIGNYLTLMGEYFKDNEQYTYYASAGYCFDHLEHENIKTPAILNSLGVIYFLQAQLRCDVPFNQLIFPVIIDNNTSTLLKLKYSNVNDIFYLNSPNTVDWSKADELLNISKGYLLKALTIDTNYIAAGLNLALVHFAQQKQGTMSDHLIWLKKRLDSRPETKSIYFQLEAFYNWLKGDKQMMNKSFNNSIKLNDPKAKYNQDILNGSVSNHSEVYLKTDCQLITDTLERIFDKQIAQFFERLKHTMDNETRIEHYDGKIDLWSEINAEGTIYMIRIRDDKNFSFRDIFYFEIENTEYTTSKGLKLNDNKNKLRELYGEPCLKNSSSGFTQYLYPSQYLIVTFSNSSDLVKGITYYGLKD